MAPLSHGNSHGAGLGLAAARSLARSRTHSILPWDASGSWNPSRWYPEPPPRGCCGIQASPPQKQELLSPLLETFPTRKSQRHSGSLSGD